jgi:Fur family ferric uptake transcriptional regulator
MKNKTDYHVRVMLKTAKLYCTQHRISILNVLFQAGKPLSQEQIASRLGKNGFDKVTIYRTLESFVKAGLVHKAFVDKRASHYELAHNCTEKQCHPHFTCTKCGNTHCLMEISLPMAASPHKGFVIHRQQVHLEGLCPKCAQ